MKTHRCCITLLFGICTGGAFGQEGDFPLSSWEMPAADPAVKVPDGLPAFYPVKDLQVLAERERIVSVHEDENSVVLTATLDEHLDLAAELSRAEGKHSQAPVPLGPRIVAGQGADPANLTFVKILNRHGIADIQFLSHPALVKGGVNVAAARRQDGGFSIAAAPISDAKVRSIPIFNEYGGKTGEFLLPGEVSPPVLVVAGDFLKEQPGEEFAVTSKLQKAPLLIISTEGKLLRTLGPLLPDARNGDFRIEPMPNAHGGHDLLASAGKHWQRLTFDGVNSLHLNVEKNQEVTGVFPSAFDSNRMLLTTADPLRSVWLETDDAETFRPLDVGAFESRFWFDLNKNHAGAKADWTSPPDGEYVRSATYAHIRAETANPRFNNPASLEKNPQWTAEEAKQAAQRAFGKYDKPLDQQDLRMWEPTFTHRMGSWFKPWADTVDARTGLPRYAALDRDGHPDNYEEGVGAKKSEFLISTYAYGLPALDSLFNQSLRAFLDALSPRFRAHPEKVFSMEPNHEHEINIGGKKSVGDYNPKMVEGFFLYLAGLYGNDIAKINQAMGTAFTTHFDAPRDLGRGEWDKIEAGNPFYDAWYFYNRYIVNRRISNTFRESLLAGFPPEVIKSHQIPDSFAVSSTKEFSSSQRRITPVDYALSSGVGFGYTRYSMWYQKANMLDAAHSSGFDSIILGEYNALSANKESAIKQLDYIFENGGIGVHCMYWPAAWNPKSPEFNKSMEAAVKSLREKERPRPGYAGGVARVVPWKDGERVMNIASLGTGEKNVGLIKSLREDGTWEGSVYAVPFRTTISTETLLTKTQRPAAGQNLISSAPANGLEGGDQLEITFRAKSTVPAKIRFQVKHLESALPGLTQELEVTPNEREYRLIVRSPLPADGIVLALESPDSVVIKDPNFSRQTAEIARLHRNKMKGTRNRGGVMFDVME